MSSRLAACAAREMRPPVMQIDPNLRVAGHFLGGHAGNSLTANRGPSAACERKKADYDNLPNEL